MSLFKPPKQVPSWMLVCYLLFLSSLGYADELAGGVSPALASAAAGTTLTWSHAAGVKLQLADLPASPLSSQISALPATAQQKALTWLQSFSFTKQDTQYLRVDNTGGVYYADTFIPPVAVETPFDQADMPSRQNITATEAFSLHSKPGSSNVVYLDFNGHVITNTDWNSTYSTLTARPYDLDGVETSFSSAELDNIAEIWRRVAEDYAAFDIDVTTAQPSTFGNKTGRVVITRDTDASGKSMPAKGAGGVAYVNVWGTSIYASTSPAFVYFNNLGGGRADYVTEAASHELGHNLGLSHDGTSSAGYYGGHGSGYISWGPIMGTGYERQVSQWSKGEYTGANNTEDDVSIIATKLTTRVDDHSNTSSGATAIVTNASGSIISTNPITDPSNATPANKGIIQSRTDVDTFYFNTAGGNVTLRATPAWQLRNMRGGNLDIRLALYDSNGNLVVDNDKTTDTDAEINVLAAAGRYYLTVDGVGSSVTPYSDYGSLGQYFLTGNFPVSTSDTTPDAFTFTSQTGVALSSLVTSNEITVSGINVASPISVAGGKYSINSGAYVTTAGSVKNGDKVKVQHTASASYATKTDSVLTIGGIKGTFSSTTLAAPTTDTTPDAFIFTDQTGVALSTLVTSNEIAVSGINAASPISVTGGKYSINNAAYVSTAGSVKNGDKVKVQHTSSASYAAKVDTVLTIGGVSDTFTSTTKTNTATNNPPTANAGPDQVVNASAKVTLSGSGTDPDNDTLSYAWTQTSGTTVALSGANTATASFTAPNVTADTTLSFNLTVKDGKGGTATDDLVIVVKKVGSQTGVTGLAAGDDYTCAVVNGGVQCWGSNEYGGLGDGTTTDRLTPVQAIAAGSGATAVAAGYYHTCAVINGGVQCWGWNEYGQLGDDTAIDRLTPVQVIPANSGVTAVAGGAAHTCALANGGVQCWGDNGYGQLGDGTYDSSFTPVQIIPTGSGVSAIATGAVHSCAVLNAGVQCWGYNDEGELGDGTTTTSFTPVQTIAENSNVTSLAGADYHTCALVNGGVKCWGYNSGGELGNGTTITSLSPVQTIPAGSNVTSLGEGDSHTCAVANGGVKCWGRNNYGQLGDGSTLNRLTPVQTIPEGSGASIVAGGYYHTCALVAGKVKCWGSNSFGQFGNGNTTGSYKPVDGPLFPDTPTDTTPDAFSFADQTDVALSTVVTSNEITVSGINASTPISVTGGKYSINSGAYTATAGTVNNGDKVKVQHTSSASYATKIDTLLTIGGVSDTFTSTTKAAAPNTPPTANAGADQSVNAGASVSLPGSGTDADGDTLSYAWTQTAGTPTVTLSSANTATATFTAPNVTADTRLTFTLTVSDGKGGTASDSVDVTVKATTPTTPDVVVSFQEGDSYEMPLGADASLKLVLNAGNNPVDSFDLAFSFDPAIVSVKEITLASGWMALVNTIDNTQGKVSLAAGLDFSSASVTGSAPLATVTFTPKAKGTSSLSLSGIEVAGEGKSYKTAGKNLSLTVIEKLFKGQIAYPSSVTDEGKLAPLTVLIADKTTLAIKQQKTVTPDASGLFVIPVPLTSEHAVVLKGEHSLSQQLLVGAGSADQVVNFGTFYEGDASGDDKVGSLDFSLLRSSYGKAKTDASFNAKADFTADGVVKTTDFSLLRVAYGKDGAGKAIWANKTTTAVKTQVANGAVLAAANVAFDPATVTLNATQTEVDLKVKMSVDSGVAVDAMDIVLQYDPTVLSVVSATDTSGFENKFKSLSADPKTGLISMSVATFTPKTGAVDLMSLRVKFLGKKGTATAMVFTKATEISGTRNGTVAVVTGVLGKTLIQANTAPTATAASATTNEDVATAITLVGTDADGDALTYSLATQPAHGAVALVGNKATYTPAKDYNGTDSFTFTVSDGKATSAPASVSLTVKAVNDAPTANAGADQTVNPGVSVSLTGVGTDVDADKLTYAWKQTAGTPTLPLTNATTASVSFTAPSPTADTRFTFALTVSDGKGGTTSDSVDVVVKAVDTKPDVFTFTDQTGVALSSVVTSNEIAVSGINAPSAISVTGGKYSLNGGAYVTTTGTVKTGDKVKVQHTSSTNYAAKVDTVLTIGGVVDTFSSTTAAKDTTPDAFTFTDQTGVALSSTVTSNEITVSGINAPTAISISNGKYSLNGGAFIATAGTVKTGDKVKVQHTSSANYAAKVDTVLTIGGVSDTFSSTTAAKDTTPDAFACTDQTNVALSAVVTSNELTVAGINAPTAISVTGGKYSINNGAFTATAGTVKTGDKVKVQHTSSANYAAKVDTVLTIGGVSDTFSSTTAAKDTTPDAFAFATKTGVVKSKPVESDVIKVSGINAATAISITGGDYRINGGTYTSAAGTVKNADTVQIRHTASASAKTSVTSTVTIGGVKATFTSTTAP